MEVQTKSVVANLSARRYRTAAHGTYPIAIDEVYKRVKLDCRYRFTELISQNSRENVEQTAACLPRRAHRRNMQKELIMTVSCIAS